ncbi:MAG: tetratricopeptide repeat protein [Planctomycetota bacterium]
MKLLSLTTLTLVTLCACAAEPPAPPRLSRELSDYLRRSETNIRILDGALLICKHAHPELDLDAERKAIKSLASDLTAALAGTTSLRSQADATARFLFESQQFGLPERDDASAFLLTDVRRNKRGNCLGLSVLCLALAEESGLKVFGVPVPSRSSDSGHMLVRFDDGNTRRNFDPAQRGVEHADSYYQREFKLTDSDLRSGYVLSNAKRRDVLAMILVNLGGAFVDAGRPADALPVLEAALTVRSESAAAQSNLAAARLMLGDTIAAEKGYAAALKIDPNFFPARIGQADVALKKNDPNASKLVDAVLALEPENVQARTMLASLQLQRKDLAGALKTLNDLSVLPTADVTVWTNLGRCYALSGDVALSEISFRRALMFDDKNADAHCGLGRALIVNGKKKEAAIEFEAALTINPKHADAKAALADMGQPMATLNSNDTPKKSDASNRKPIDYPPGTNVIPFKIISNRIFVRVRLNDQADADAIVDTGTEVTLLNSARVKVDGLKPVGAENLLGNMIGRIAVQMVALDSLKLGDTIIKKQTIGRMDQGVGTKFESIDFVLGMDVLSKTPFTLDFDQSLLVLWPTGSKLPAPNTNINRTQITLVHPSGMSPLRPYFVASCQKYSATFLLDTAADIPMFIAFKKPADMGFSVASEPMGKAMIYESTGKQELSVYPTTFSILEINKAVFTNVEGRVLDASGVFSPVVKQSLSLLNVIGAPFLKTLSALHIDVTGRTVWLDRVKSAQP